MIGLRWMVSLYNNHLNGILADEMVGREGIILWQVACRGGGITLLHWIAVSVKHCLNTFISSLHLRGTLSLFSF